MGWLLSTLDIERLLYLKVAHMKKSAVNKALRGRRQILQMMVSS